MTTKLGIEMAHNIDMTNGRANIAFLGSKNDVWHRLGHEMPEGKSIEEWAKEAGLDWHAVKVPAIADLSDGTRWSHIPTAARLAQARDRSFVVRSDNGAMLGDNCVSDVYQPVQPAEILAWFDKYISVDERFQLDVAGSLKGGSIIWATARFRSPVEIAGDNHMARVLMSTTFDGSGATINQMTTTRVVCQNTLRAAHSDKHKAIIRTRHNTRFNAERVGGELAQLAQSIAGFKAIGDAMAQVTMTAAEVSAFFKTCLDIPLEAKHEDISTRKANQFRALSQAFTTTRRERNAKQGDPIDVWSALQAVTRYVDHDRVSINGDQGEKQFFSAQFGSGDALKGVAMELLMPRVRDLIAA
jgi:phage/plasmid-like protein (TIGR03299 family)